MGNIFLLLIITAAASLLLGMGLPTTANYIIMASLTAPVLVELASGFSIHGVQLAVPLMAAHLYCFYFGILADDTPPVGLAAYAGAAIANASPIAVGIQGFFYDIRTALLPLVFIFNHDIILWNINSLPEAVMIFCMTSLGMVCFSSMIQGMVHHEDQPARPAASSRRFGGSHVSRPAHRLLPASGTAAFRLSGGPCPHDSRVSAAEGGRTHGVRGGSGMKRRTGIIAKRSLRPRAMKKIVDGNVQQELQCAHCKTIFPDYLGRCPECGSDEWTALVEVNPYARVPMEKHHQRLRASALDARHSGLLRLRVADGRSRSGRVSAVPVRRRGHAGGVHTRFRRVLQPERAHAPNAAHPATPSRSSTNTTTKPTPSSTSGKHTSTAKHPRQMNLPHSRPAAKAPGREFFHAPRRLFLPPDPPSLHGPAPADFPGRRGPAGCTDCPCLRVHPLPMVTQAAPSAQAECLHRPEVRARPSPSARLIPKASARKAP